ncbi:MAG: ABC transporter permease subunit [Proteobacteria bacterium]|nr:ABC transporter permease subunit [Pseudomonadota bacterium]
MGLDLRPTTEVPERVTAPRHTDRSAWRRRLGSLLLTIILLVFTLLVLVPFIWMVVMSLRTTAGILANPYGLPLEFRWRNYVNLMTDPDIRFYRFYFNSAFVSFFALVLSTVLAAMGGYGFGRPRYNFKFREPLFFLLLFALMLPVQVMYIPQFQMMSRYGLLNSRWSLILIYTATALPVSTYLMRTYFSQLPQEVEDAARIDGCNDWRLFRHVMLPMARPALVTVVLINFVYFWNELLLAMTLVTDPEKRTLPVAMMNFVGEHGSNFSMAATSLVTAMIPLVVAYLFLSEFFIKGLTGAVKG